MDPETRLIAWRGLVAVLRDGHWLIRQFPADWGHALEKIQRIASIRHISSHRARTRKIAVIGTVRLCFKPVPNPGWPEWS